MNFFRKLGSRSLQAALRMALPFLPYRKPRILGSTDAIAPVLQEKGISSILLVTGPSIRKRGLTQALEKDLADAGISVTVYDGTCQNPTTHNVEAARALYLENSCEALVAFGGGSPIDCAKAVGARLSYPKRSLARLKGTLKVRRKLPLLFAIPTTAGSGSEITPSAVISDPDTKHKYTINSFPLIPRYAVLDARVTCSVPAHLTATTGLDALTHAVEAYLGNSTTRTTRAQSLEAVDLIFRHLARACADGSDLAARSALLRASHLAGAAFSKSYVGYVHAVAHTLGGEYNVAHGHANAVLLPVVLSFYGEKIDAKLRRLAVAAGVATEDTPRAVAAKRFLDALSDLNASLGIPTFFPELKASDIPRLARIADREANPLYPVPVLFSARELEAIYRAVLPPEAHLPLGLSPA